MSMPNSSGDRSTSGNTSTTGTGTVTTTTRPTWNCGSSRTRPVNAWTTSSIWLVAEYPSMVRRI